MNCVIPSGTVSALALRAVLEAARGAGVDVQRLVDDLGLSAPLLEDRDARFPCAVEVRCWSEAGRRSSDPAFGLHLAERLPVGAYDLVDYAARSSQNLGEALRCVLRFNRILNDTFSLHVETQGNHVTLRQLSSLQPFSRHMPEAFWAALVIRGRQLTGRDWAPVSVHFPHPRPADTSEHQRIFRCALGFGQAVSELVIEASVLDLPIQAADSALLALIAYHADAAIARLPLAPRSVVDQVRRVLVQTIRGGDTSLEWVARKLHMNTRTLQRRLRQHGTSHKQLLDAVRLDLAKSYLEDRHISLCEIAFLLGFSEVSAFHRAFRRWTRKTPAEYRLLADSR